MGGLLIKSHQISKSSESSVMDIEGTSSMTASRTTPAISNKSLSWFSRVSSWIPIGKPVDVLAKGREILGIPASVSYTHLRAHET